MGSDLKVDNNILKNHHVTSLDKNQYKTQCEGNQGWTPYFSSVSAQKGTKCSSTTTESGSSPRHPSHMC